MPGQLFLLIATITLGAQATTPTNDTKAPSQRQYVGYVSDPDGRGTASLVLSCLLTLILCVWSALHLNVPAAHRRSNIKAITWLNIRWIFAGIYAPELVVFVAWRQWCSARMLQKHIEELHGHTSGQNTEDKPPPPPGSRRVPWTMTHSFFACAGGFAVELHNPLNANTVSGRRDEDATEAAKPARLTLTARGVLFLAQQGIIPSVYKEEIEDKSKANDLAKATVLVQATWMLIQVIGRLAARLPVTLLEVNTVAHVLCAFAMYIFWWNKPLLPTEPIIIRHEDEDELAPLVAFMYSSSEMSGQQTSPSAVKAQTIVKTLLANILQYSTTPEMEGLCIRCDSTDFNDATPPATQPIPKLRMPSTTPSFSASIHESLEKNESTAPEEHTLSFGQQTKATPTTKLSMVQAPQSCLQLLQASREKEKGTAFFERRPRVIHHAAKNQHSPSSSDQHRWKLIEQALQTTPSLLSDRILLSHKITSLPPSTSTSIATAQSSCCIHLKPEQLVATHISNWPSNDLLRNVNGLVVGMTLWLANLCYGAFHLAAWNDHFPSTAEKWLWRVSAAYIAFCGGFWVILNSAVSKWARLNTFWEKWMDGEKSLLQSLTLGATVIVCGLSLTLARLYVVVEAFMSIRQLPIEAYRTPQWTDVFPHL